MIAMLTIVLTQFLGNFTGNTRGSGCFIEK
ncbi:Uncharacterised protein [Providencia rettgeri]|uniref:Uncharacterized protein n=1 Tax=Providencia rettgeri TaxID=587 RepID=A0A9N8GVJ5_PRORE|nr:hypothetical protein [Providencia rettgeri]CAB5590680.1 Uncharacterised protein [Providencia rettgeri]CAB5665277.1 Uncharacterised protein [Providencia rettgeri]CAB5695410.1 Uncharacterised protein [Providencia rettgeri]CAC9147179.1 Uncharacterised protein [Providencia rettgeri]